MSAPALQPRQFLALMAGPAAFAMIGLIVVQELFGAATTWLVIRIARDITDGQMALGGFAAIVATQTLSYLAGAVSWIYAERAGFAAYARYILRFARSNRARTALLTDVDARERTEPFLTNETFHICFSLVYDLQFHLRLLFNILFNAAVFGLEIDAGLPVAYVLALTVLVALQWLLRKPLTSAYLRNQQMTNRMTARCYNLWDNVTTGNRYNLRLWLQDFRRRWDDALAAQIRAILMREGWSAASGLIALLIVLAATALVASRETGNLALLVGLAATLPRQIEMTLDLHQLTAGMTDLVAIWARIGGVCAHLRPAEDPGFAERIDFGRLRIERDGQVVDCAGLDALLREVLSRPAGRLRVRAGNGAGKSTLLMALKAALPGQPYYLPPHDRLSFRFNQSSGTATAAPPSEETLVEAEGLNAEETAAETAGYSSGERQLAVLREIVAHTDCPAYLLDEWDANLDAANHARAEALVATLAHRAVVVEISHRAA